MKESAIETVRFVLAEKKKEIYPDLLSCSPHLRLCKHFNSNISILKANKKFHLVLQTLNA